MWLLQVPPKISNPFLTGHSNGFTLLSKPNSSVTVTHSSALQIKAMRTMQGKVVCSTNDKTVAVEVVRLAPHPKYKRRVKKKKKFQAHDPDNQFQVGDIVQLQKTRPISKTKTFLAVPVPKKTSNKTAESESQDLSISFESQQPQP